MITNLAYQVDLSQIEADITALQASSGGLNYSATEQDTNITYIGGDKIYEKTLVFAAGPNDSTVSIAHGITGLKRIVDVQAFMDNGTIQRNVNNAEASEAIQSHYSIDDTNILFSSAGAEDYSGYDGFFKLRYTKTA